MKGNKIMKKYIKPCAKIIKVDNNAILAGSPDVTMSGDTTPTMGSKRGRNTFFEDDYED